ncbi:nitrate reductase [Marinobacterium nitratireducens]|uniref:Nitrate reductase n=1 Tax=Marinobacterium nitratireducens TaxID=518897 RepID=A0A917ZPT7_9GAMM|nr:nitrate reductase [Marinobacterium nitratireducens]GGO87513.1 nitrate reductase [Marinobacterium nitratireducens]
MNRTECTTSTTCPYCGVGCGVEAKVEQRELIAVSGDRHHPANAGRLCVKGSALHETTGHEGRLLRPRVKGRDVSWDSALDEVAGRFTRLIEEHGPDSVAFYLSGQILTEDYYVANKLMKGFIGSANVDTNSRLCMSSAVAAQKRAFGSDSVPACYEDLELADLVVLVGSNAAWAHPILYQRLARARERRPGMKVVVLDPRRTATCDLADRHLALKPGSDGYLFNGLLTYLADRNALDQTYIERHCEGFDEALAAAREQCPDIATTAALCGLPAAELEWLYQRFAATERSLTLYSQGINQSSSGTDKANAIINCHLATGRVGKPGASPFSLTGQPNAMGGREVGGLANQLAAHMDFANPDHLDAVRTFWQAPRLAQNEGLKAVDLFRAVEAGDVKAVWIIGTNPAFSLPDAARVRRALERCELVVVSDCVADTDTTRLADILLPATTWAEKNGTVTNSERRISRQRSLLPPPGEARHDWQILCDVATRMGFGEAFAYRHPAEIFREHAALSGFRNNGSRDFDISALAQLSQAQYDALAPIQWPVTDRCPEGTARLFGDGGFYTPSGRARLLPVWARPPATPCRMDELVLNTGRVRDQWHSMTRTARSPRLLEHCDEPYVEIHAQDASRRGIANGDLVRLHAREQSYIGRARISDGQRPGSLFAPMHWNDRYTAAGCVDALVAPVTDPVSGQPESKQSPVRLEVVEQHWRGLLLSLEPIDALPCDYWSRASLPRGERYRLAGFTAVEDWRVWLEAWLPAGNDRIELLDSRNRHYRAASFRDGRLQWVFIGACDGELPSHGWLGDQLGKTLDAGERARLLAGRPCNGEAADQGAIVCACLQVGEKRILKALGEKTHSVESLGRELGCGTNCGSCIPELKALIGEKRG